MGVKEIIMTDFFRLFRISYRIPSSIKALVLPKITRVSNLKSIDSLAALPQRTSLRDRTEPDIVVRDYVTGDSLKQIHWKATARTQELKARNLTGEEKQGISLLWDTRRYSKEPKDYLPIEDKILETALAISIFLAEKNIPFSAYFSQRDITSAHLEGLGDFDGFYRQVSEIQFDQEENFQQTLLEMTENGTLFESKVIFCVLHQLNEDILKLAERLERAGSLVVLYVITDENIEDFSRQSNERLQIMAISVDASLEGRL